MTKLQANTGLILLYRVLEYIITCTFLADIFKNLKKKFNHGFCSSHLANSLMKYEKETLSRHDKWTFNSSLCTTRGTLTYA